MIWFIILVIGLSIYEILQMIKKEQKKELIVFSVFAVVTLAFGVFYLSDPYRQSLVSIIMSFLKIEH